MKIKNIVLIFLISFLSISSIFSLEENDKMTLKVKAEVLSEPYIPIIYYNNIKLFNNANILDLNNSRFDISQSGETGIFKLKVIGNLNESKRLNVIISGKQFRGLEGTDTENVNTGLYLYAVDNKDNINSDYVYNYSQPFISTLTIPKGPHLEEDRIIETEFKLIWGGNSNLPAGLYSCDIDIEYFVVD